MQGTVGRLRGLPIWVRRWLDAHQPPESAVFGGAAVVVGLLAGSGVWLFKRLIDVVHLVSYQTLGAGLMRAGPWALALIPAVGGLIVGFVMHRFVGPERHHGVAGIIEATALAGGRIPYRRTPFKVASAALAIGAGASVGPEDPSVQIGASLGSFLGQLLHLSDERVRALVAAGAAAGIAAAFNAPIAGLFFALEVILGELSATAFGITTLAAVTSAVLTQAVSGPEPAFAVPPYPFQSILELPLYLVLGLLAGPVAALYVKLLYFFGDLFRQHVRGPAWVRPAIAGLIVGLVGLFLPGVLAVGYDVIGGLLNGGGGLALGLVFALMLAKLVLTPVSIGGGFPGGVFAPSLFIGATLGFAFGAAMSRLFPSLGVQPSAFAMVGMAAVLAGAVHAPLTAVILLFEMTHDYRIILPLLFAVAISLALSRYISADSVYMLGLARHGIRLRRGLDVDVLESLTVGEVMSSVADALPESATLAEADHAFALTHHHGMPVVDRHGALVGVVTLSDLQRAHEQGAGLETTVGAVCTREVLTAFGDESIGAALRRMSVRDVGRLPVVSRNQPRQLLGMLTRADVIRAYDLAATRRAVARHRQEQVRLGIYSGAQTAEVRVPAGAAIAGHRVREIDWPASCVIASIRRRGQVIIPRGETIVLPDDVLIAVVTDGAEAALRQLVM